MMLMNREDTLPYSILLINVFVLSFLLIIPRVLSRILYDKTINKHNTNINKVDLYNTSAILIGESESVLSFLSNNVFTTNFVGIISPNINDIGVSIRGIPVIDHISNFPRTLQMMKSQGIVLKYVIVINTTISDEDKDIIIKHTQEHDQSLVQIHYNYTTMKAN